MGKYVPNLVARPFELTQDFIDAILAVVPSTRLAKWDLDNADENSLVRTLMIELLSWQFASPVRWIETQELLINNVDEIVEIGLAASPTLTNLALRSMDVLGVHVPVFNVERDQDVVMLNDVAQPPVFEEPEEEPAAEETAPAVPAAPVAPATDAPAAVPTTAPAAPAAAAGPAPELNFTAADAINVLFAFQNKIRVDQIAGSDTTEILTGGVSSRRNQLLMDLSAELGVAAIDGAADAEITVLHQRVNIAAPTYKPYGPVLTDALTATLRQLFGSAGVKPSYVGERVTGPWALPQSWVPWVEAEVLLGTREGESVRGGALGELPNKVANKSEADALIDEAIQAVARREGVSVSLGSAGGGAGVAVDSAALDEFAEKIIGYHGILAENARTILAELGHLPDPEVQNLMMTMCSSPWMPNWVPAGCRMSSPFSMSVGLSCLTTGGPSLVKNWLG